MPNPCPLLHYMHHFYSPLAPTTLQKQTIPRCIPTLCITCSNPVHSRYSASSIQTDSALMVSVTWLLSGSYGKISHELGHSSLLQTRSHTQCAGSVSALPCAGKAPVKVITLGTLQTSPGRCPQGSLNEKYQCSSYFYSSCENGAVRSTKAIAPGTLGLVHLLLT